MAYYELRRRQEHRQSVPGILAVFGRLAAQFRFALQRSDQSDLAKLGDQLVLGPWRLQPALQLYALQCVPGGWGIGRG